VPSARHLFGTASLALSALSASAELLVHLCMLLSTYFVASENGRGLIFYAIWLVCLSFCYRDNQKNCMRCSLTGR